MHAARRDARQTRTVRLSIRAHARLHALGAHVRRDDLTLMLEVLDLVLTELRPTVQAASQARMYETSR